MNPVRINNDTPFRKFFYVSQAKLRSNASERMPSPPPLPSSTLHERGPFDIIGDVHGCYDELLLLLGRLGYRAHGKKSLSGLSFDIPVMQHPKRRKVIFVGDLVDRGPKSIPSVLLAQDMRERKVGYCLMGNHEDKLRRHLSPKNQAAPPRESGQSHERSSNNLR